MKFSIDKSKLKKLNNDSNKDIKEKKHTILLVDDELSNLEALQRLLEDDYIVIKAQSGIEALDLLKNHSAASNVSLIISDQRMPKMTGVEFLKHTISIVPSALRIILTGFMDMNDIIDSINEGRIYKFLLKPLEPTEFLISIKRALEAYELEVKNLKLIDQLKETNKNLEKSRAYLNTIFNSVNDAIFIHDVYGNIIDVNDTCTHIYGYSHDELIGMNLTDIVSKNSPCTGEDVLSFLSQGNFKNNKLVVEAIAKNKNNEEFWVETSSHDIMFDEKIVFLAAVRNITERKNAELASKNEALELERLRTEFFANISHELRTPLNIILGAIQIISMDIKDKGNLIDIQKILKNISIEKQNCFRLLRLINNLIDSTKLDSGYFDLNMVNCNIISVIEEITLSVAEYMNINNINLIFDTDVEEKILACDPDKIERIMLNLLSNAIKFTGDGGHIYVNILDGEEYITIVVEDTGTGIPEEKINIIFDRFRQVDKSFTRSCEGSGIGLSLVKSLLEMQGAEISVESKYGAGTKFIIKFPVGLSSDNEEEKTAVNYSCMNHRVEKIKVEFSDIYK